LLRQRPPAVQEQLMGLLQDCWFRMPAPEARRWLAEVLEKADGDRWRQQVRQVIERTQWAALERMLREPEAERQPVAFLVFLGQGSQQVLPTKTAIELLRRAQQQYPGDFWINFELGGALYRSVFSRGAGARPARAAVNEAVAFLRVAVGLRPGNGPAHVNLG